jgi:ABC-type spermidine/putrescine transport system permease subunit II
VIVPAIVLGISFYTLVLQAHVAGQVLTFIFANVLLTTPIVTLLVAASAQNMDPRLEFASLSCGAGPVRTIRRVTLPYVAPTALAGAAIAFLLSIDEVVMSVFLVTPGQTPLAVKMFLQVQNGTAPIVTAAATLIIVTSLLLAALITASRAAASRREARSRRRADALLTPPNT